MYQSPPIAEIWVDGVRRVWPDDNQIKRFSPDLCRTQACWLPEGVTVFCQSGYQTDSPADYARLAIWDYALSEAEIKALGKAGDPTDIGR